MEQTKLVSMIEALVNIVIGVGVALGSQYLVFPLVGIHNVSHTTHLEITAWFTLISFARSYVIRRFFATGLHNTVARFVTRNTRGDVSMFNRTVDSVLASFNKTIASLEDIAIIEANKATSKRDQAATLVTEADVSDAESVRASNIATKLSGLLS